MRKKISSILIGIILMFAGVFVSACGDKYKDFKFEISYALSENAKTWYDAGDKILLNYTVDQDTGELVFDINGQEERVDQDDFKVYLKVEVKNVESKHLDSITVSAENSTGIAFSSSTIKNGKTVTVPVVGLGSSKFSIYENKSRKSTKVDMSIYGKLTDIELNTNIVPVVSVGGSLDFKQIENIVKYNPNGILTNQTGVRFAVKEFGYFSGGTFITAGTDLNKFVRLDKDVLKLNAVYNTQNFALSNANNVIRLEAISVYDSNITTDVYVYIVEGDLVNPVAKFRDGTDVNSLDLTHPGVDLYFDSDISKHDMDQYKTSTLTVDSLNSIYNGGVNIANGKTLKYETKVYVGNEEDAYDFGEISAPVRNLTLTNSGNEYTLNLVSRSAEKEVGVKFAYELVADDNDLHVVFTNNKPVLETNVAVRKHVLASSILIGGENYENGDEVNGIVDATSNPSYIGYTLELGIDPIDPYALQTQVNEISWTSSNLDIVNNYGTSILSGSSLLPNSKLFIKFNSSVESEQVTIKTRRSPVYYDGATIASGTYITIKLNLQRKVTADALQFVDAAGNGINELNVAANGVSSIYIKASHTGTLDVSRLTLTSSGFALNDNGALKILFDSSNCSLVESGTGYSIFKIQIPATLNAGNSTFNVYAGEVGNGATSSVVVKSVQTITNAENIKITTNDTDRVTAFEGNKFAIINNAKVTFNVVEMVGENKVSNTIQGVSLNDVAVDESVAAYFGGADVLSKSEFNNLNRFELQGWAAKTRVFNVEVSYYIVDVATNEVKSSSKTIENVQFAVYNPITSINATAKESIVYVNKMFTEVATTDITYSSYSGAVGNVPSEKVYFINEDGSLDSETGKNATSVQVSIDKDLKSYSNVVISQLKNGSYQKLDNNKNLIETAKKEGTLKLQLTSSFETHNDITFTITAKRFGELSSAQKFVTIAFAKVDRANGFDVDATNLVEYSSTNRELQLSFMDAAENTVSKDFTINPTYNTVAVPTGKLRFTDMDYLLYKYSLKDGEIVYEANGEPKLTQINANSLSVSFDDNKKVTVTADKNIENIGGLYKLVIVTKDSYVDKDNKYENQFVVNIRVSDGSSVNSAYIINNADQFKRINNSLSSHYILGNNIDLGTLEYPIGYEGEDSKIIKPFSGSLSGKLTTVTESGNSTISYYTVNATVENSLQSSETEIGTPYLFGIFTQLTGKISNINFNIVFSSGLSTPANSYVGGVVGLNDEGTIKDVYVYSTGSFTLAKTSKFGSVAGVNKGTIEKCVVDSSAGLTIKTYESSNIGLVVGDNQGTITGEFDNDLSSIIYDVVANLTINNKIENTTYNIGGVAGTSSTAISNMLVGGKIYVTSKNDAGTQLAMQDSYLAGIVGTSSADLSNIVALGLDLNNADKNGIKIAGIVGSKTIDKDIIITNARYVSVLSKFKFGQTTGQIIGGDVAGIAHSATNVTYSTVESFIETLNSKVFYTLQGNNVYGLINSGSVSNSFVRANIDAETKAYLTSSTDNKTQTYFIGQVEGSYETHSTYYVVYNASDFSKAQVYKDSKYTDIDFGNSVVEYEDNTDELLEGVNIEDIDGSFVVYYQDPTNDNLYTKLNGDPDGATQYYRITTSVENVYYYDSVSKVYVLCSETKPEIFDKLYEKVENRYLNTTAWENQFKDLGFVFNNDYNTLTVVNYPNLVWYFPYIVKNGSPLQILAPSSVEADINQNYQISTEKNVYIDDIEIEDGKTPPTYTIEETIIVNFFENDYSNDQAINKHCLVNTLCANCSKGEGDCLDVENCDNGLIDLTMLPAQTGLTFEIVKDDNNCAKIVDNTFIQFAGASNNDPVIVRAYSIFNQEAEAYFAIYSQKMYSELILEGKNVRESATDDYDYYVNVYQGQTGNVLSIEARNYINGTEYDSIFDAALAQGFITIVAEDYNNDVLNVNASTKNTISISILPGVVVSNDNDQQDLTFKVVLNKSYFNNEFVKNDVILGEIKVKVLLHNIAEKIEILGADAFEFDTSSTLNFDVALKTGYVVSGDSTTEEQQLTVTSANGIVSVNVENKDSIKLTMSSSSAEMLRLLEKTGEEYIADLFNFEIYSIRTDNGYKYHVSAELKNEHDYRYITENIDVELKVWAETNGDVQTSVNVTILPTTANTIRLVNYAVQKVNVVSDTKSELTMGNVETSIIAPGGRGNIMLAYVEKSYANIDSISITSSKLNVPSLGGNVNLIFTQLVYNESTHKFETLFNAGTTAQDGDTLKLQALTTSDGEYTGLIYIHVQLRKLSGLNDSISATLNVTSNGKVLSGVTKTLTTEYLPGAELNYSGEVINGGYLIQEETFENSASIKLYGYQFNSNPDMNINWELPNGVDYFYKLDAVNVKIEEDNTIADVEAAFNANKLYYFESGKYYKATTSGDYLSGEIVRDDRTFYSISNKKVIVKEGVEYNISNYVFTYFIKDYNSISYNSVDRSYSMDVKFNVANQLPTSFSMQAALSLISSKGEVETGVSDAILFYPTQYVITDVQVANTSGNRKMLAINKTDKFEFVFSTQRSDYDYSEEIYNYMLTNGIDASEITELFTYYKESNLVDFGADAEEFSTAIMNNYLTITGISKFEKNITMTMYVGYTFVNGKYALQFAEQAQDGLKLFDYEFTLQIYPGAGEENATPIYYAYEMFDSEGNCLLGENMHYILMNDIVLDVVKPIDYAIGSLDGNNFKITIKNFAVDVSKNAFGLFATLGTYTEKIVGEDGSETVVGTKKTILKNVVVDYSEFNTENNGALELLNMTSTDITFGGLVAINNGGLIYNCDVINKTTGSNKNISINITLDEKISGVPSLTFGGLVGQNDGIITNSRVGTSKFTKINAKNDTSSTEYFGSITFTLGSSSTSNFEVVAGGFVGENNGTISSSYFANSSLINYSNSNEINVTGGFVGKNNSSARIMFSYVKAEESSIDIDNPQATGARIEGKSNSIIAGFVYENSGSINDCYANTELYTKSTYMAGFVYINKSNGVISESYAACTMKQTTETGSETNNEAKQPFVGKDISGNYLNEGELTNVYYLISSSNESQQGIAQGLSSTNFQKVENLTGFVFVQSDVKNQREQGVWSYITTDNKSVILPELMNANTIAYSAKYLLRGNGTSEKFTYTNAASFSEGTKNNPHIIRNVEEYNSVLTASREDMYIHTAKTGYIRLIDDIDFADSKTAIRTRINFTLGDANNESIITSFEGNGMTIDGIYYDASTGVSEIGLFAKVENAYIKNVNLNFAKPQSGGQYSTTQVKYSGGLAGIIRNSGIINVTLNGSNVSLTGQNFVGGLAGLIEGDCIIQGITSNLSVVATSTSTNLYYSKNDFKDLGYIETSYSNYISGLSYAGGLAGVLNLNDKAKVDYNLAYINIRGDEMFVNTNSSGAQLPNISAEYAGGVAGFASQGTSAFRLKYYVGKTDWINGNTVAGGLFGVSLGKITASQVTVEEELQYTYDTELGEYIIDIDKLSLNSAEVGNLKLIQSNGYAGGLVGVGINNNIIASYSKAGIGVAQPSNQVNFVGGGLIGLAVASKVTYSYAVPYINLTNNVTSFKFGGMFGSTHKIEKSNILPDNSTIRSYEALAKVYLNRENSLNTIVKSEIQFTFSTVLLNKAEINNAIITGIDYVSAYSGNGDENITISSNVFAGSVGYKANGSNLIVEKTNTNITYHPLKKLYNLADTEQGTIFREIFDSWSVIPYWSIIPSKYFPLLTNDGVDNYIIIETTQDLDFIRSNPSGKFLVVNDIDGGNYRGNWFFGDNPFTGELIGQLDVNNNRRKKIYNISVTPNTPNQSAGLFKETKNALIQNLEFVWLDGGNGAIQTSYNHTAVSGLSCKDVNSTFRNIEVSVSGSGYLFNSSTTVNNFAGLINSATDSVIRDCTFVGKANVNLTGEAYFGGLVGDAEKKENDETMSIENSQVGSDGTNLSKPQVEFTINVSDSCTKAYIGGAVAHITNSSIYGVDVGGITYSNSSYRNIAMNITLPNSVSLTANIGGLIGYSTESTIKNSDACSDIIVTNNADTDGTYSTIIGGLAGQVVGKFDDTAIVNSNAKSTIDVAELTTNTLYASAGVALLNGSNISKALFTGEITGEKEVQEGTSPELVTKTLAAANIVAGGAVAYVTGYCNVSETMSTADIIIGSQNNLATLKAGGFAGSVSASANLTLEDVASSGKLVPICGTDTAIIHVGGMVGSVDDNSTTDTADDAILSITKAYTTTSIISDGIVGKALENTSTDALVGYAPAVSTGNVYYSTDMALTTNDHNYGTNLSVNELLFGIYVPDDPDDPDVTSDNWKDNFTYNATNWRNLVVGSSNYRLPYLINLELSLKNYGILVSSSGEYDYVEGSSLRPKTVGTSFDLAFTYYILNSASSSKSGTLNGVLIGKEDELTTSTLGLITTIGKHSAVSNVHLNLGSKNIFEVEETTDGTGFIANINNGLIFNSSVQGDNITLKLKEGGAGTSTVAQPEILAANIGLIAGTNNGAVNYCYSTAEIVETGGPVAGIVLTNNGTINSCYFTGYINNYAYSAGIMNAANDGSYVRNTYMAGVIENIEDDKTSFTFAEEFEGLNNYIDQYANIEKVNESYLKSVSTAELMDALNLDGEWHTTVSGVSVADDGTVSGGIINAAADGFGYNYGYPIYKFAKDEENLKDFAYSLNTGKGDGYTDGSIEARYNEIKTNNTVYESAYKIPHLGVLSTLQGLQGIFSPQEGWKETSRNYVVIYNIDGKMTNWTAVGSEGVAQGFKSTGGFNGVFITNPYLEFTGLVNTATTPFVQIGDEYQKVCRIGGLDNNGLFANIHDAYFADIALGSFGYFDGEDHEGLKDSGPLGTNVIGTTDVANVKYTDSVTYGSHTPAIKGVNFGGLFGTINVGKDKNITLTNFDSSNGSKSYLMRFEGNGSQGFAGLIASELKSGTITLYRREEKEETGIKYEYTNKLYPYFGKGLAAGGLVGKMSGGTIEGNGHTINIDNSFSDENHYLTSFGGIAGSITGESEINNLIVNFNNGSSNSMNTSSFGGFVASVTGSATINDCTISAKTESLTIGGKTCTHNGLMIGIIGETGENGATGSVKITNFKLSTLTTIVHEGTADSSSSFGGVVGYQKGALTVSYATDTSKNLTLETSGIPNLGGIVGHYKSGNITIYKYTESSAGTGSEPVTGTSSTSGGTGTSTGLKLNGYQNVGGFIGKAEGFPTIGKYEDQEGSSTVKKEGFNFLNVTTAYAEIKISKNANSNFGGIFGELLVGNDDVEVNNNNLITFEEISSPDADILNNGKNIFNIGGVAGKIGDETLKTSIEVKNLTNTKEIRVDKNYYRITSLGGVVGWLSNAKLTDSSNSGTITTEGVAENAISSADKSDKNNKPYAILMNVGGVVGCAEKSAEISDNLQFSGLKNEAEVNGYQNVGGLIGYATGVTLTGSIGLSDGKYLELQAQVSASTTGSTTTYELAVDGTTVTLSKGSETTGTVSGVVNVGGAVGYSVNSIITKVYANANVNGNANVGGLVGMAKGSTVLSNYVAGKVEDGDTVTTESTVSKDGPTTVKGVYYNYYYKEGTSVTYVSYIPTSVGGLIGASNETIIQNSIVHNVEITSTDEGEEDGSAEDEEDDSTSYNSKGMISTISNFMFNDKYLSGNKGYAELQLFNQNKTKTVFNNVVTGFGGFIGTLDDAGNVKNEPTGGTGSGDEGSEGGSGDDEPVVTTSETSSTTTVPYSYMNNVNIRASLGINVGAFYGTFNISSDGFSSPMIYGDLSVDGGYHIGGVAGYMTTTEGIEATNSKFGNTNLLGTGTINIQSQLSGMYVGGLFGRIDSGNASLTIDNNASNVDITITTTNSYYIGGLVGKLYVNSGNQFNGIIANNALTIVGDDAQNFGGLVGMLKCVGGVGTYSVQGTHYYPFTVNTIENQNYADGASQFDTSISEGNVLLYAQANYINQDSFNVSGSMGDYYSLGKNNPLRPSDTNGWAKEYTGFKQIQRCIPQSGTWDSIACVYNAEWITGVGTILNMQLNLTAKNAPQSPEKGVLYRETEDITDGSDKTQYVYWKGSGEGAQVFVNDQHIVYTIYQKNQDVKMLYSAIGIAELAQVSGSDVNNENGCTCWFKKGEASGCENCGTFTEFNNLKDTNITISEYYFMRNFDENGKLFGYYQVDKDKQSYTEPFYCRNGEDPGTDITSNTGEIRTLNPLDKSQLFYFDWEYNIDWITCVDPGGNADERYSTKSMVKLHYIKVNNKFYDFRVIYANDTLSDYGSNNIDKNNVPNSGSVFEIYGLSPSLTERDGTVGPTWWERNGWWVLIVIEIIITITTWGTGAIISKCAKAYKVLVKLNGVRKAAKIYNRTQKTIKTLGVATQVLKFTTAIAVGIELIVGVSAMYQEGTAGSKNLYYNAKNQNFGLLTSTTSTEIKYANNRMSSSSGTVFVREEGENEYTFKYYSTIRPADFYSSYYILTTFMENPDKTIELSEGIAKTSYGIDITDNTYTVNSTEYISKYSFKYKAGTTDEDIAELKYLYHEGSYYINANAKTLGMFRTQELSDPSIVAKTDAQLQYDVLGMAYVKGKYHTDGDECEEGLCIPGTYSYTNHNNLNKVVHNGSEYSLNGHGITGEKEFEVKYVACGADYEGDEDEVEGYDYLQNAYYTTKGTSTTDVNYIKYATFSYWGATTGEDAIETIGYTEGVDYVKRSYTKVTRDNTYGKYYQDTSTGTYQPITSYVPTTDTNEDGELDYRDYIGDKFTLTSEEGLFIISSFNGNASDVQTSNNLGYKIYSDDPNDSEINSSWTITLATYPTCFKDPYKPGLDIEGNKQDSNYYVAKATNTGTVGPEFKFNVIYYYFEGGYERWQDLGVDDSTVLGSIVDENGEIETVTVGTFMVNQIYTEIKLDDVAKSVSLYIFEANGNTTQERRIALYGDAGSDALITGSAGSYKINYSDFYIEPVDAMLEGFNTATLDSKRLFFNSSLYLRKIATNYIVAKNGKVYKRETLFTVDDEGFVNKYYEFNLSLDPKYYMNNKFLTYNSEDSNGYKDVYTMFKYTIYTKDGLKTDLYFTKEVDSYGQPKNKSKWILKEEENDIPYFLIPLRPNISRPNSGVDATYLIESCKVVLGGGVTLNYTGSPNPEGVKSGVINIS